MMVIEQINELVIPNALTKDKVLISVFTPSVRNKNGIAPATVVAVVARSAGNFLRSAE